MVYSFLSTAFGTPSNMSVVIHVWVHTTYYLQNIISAHLSTILTPLQEAKNFKTFNFSIPAYNTFLTLHTIPSNCTCCRKQKHFVYIITPHFSNILPPLQVPNNFKISIFFFCYTTDIPSLPGNEHFQNGYRM